MHTDFDRLLTIHGYRIADEFLSKGPVNTRRKITDAEIMPVSGATVK